MSYDSLQSLLTALEQQGLHYAPIVVATNLDAELPDFAIGRDVRITNRDAIIARTDLPTGQLRLSNAQTQHFSAALVVTSPTLGRLSIPRSWASVDARVRGKMFRFVTTHLEAIDPAVQLAQGMELMAGPGNTSLPVIYAGDFNSAAAGGPDTTAAYGVLVAGGLVDSWSVTNPTSLGYTWPLHDEDPTTRDTTPTERIDLVLTHGRVIAESVQLVGNTTTDKTPVSALWPSDHAGVIARLSIPNDGSNGQVGEQGEH